MRSGIAGAALLSGALVLSCAAAFAVVGCGGSDEPGEGESERRTHVYTVRGEVASLPTPTTDLRVRHEAIPEFVGAGGTVVGMNTMTMAFWPPQGLTLEEARVQELDLSGIEVGDKVTLTFEVLHGEDWSIRGYYATRIEALDVETELDFSALEQP